MASIEAKRDEILRLIARVNQRSSAPAVDRSKPKGKAAKSPKVVKYLKDLGEIKQRRIQLEQGLVGESQVDLFKMLETRIEALERLVLAGSASVGAMPQGSVSQGGTPQKVAHLRAVSQGPAPLEPVPQAPAPQAPEPQRPASQRSTAQGPQAGAAAGGALASPVVPGHTLGGAIQEGLLADILQLVSSNMMTGEMVVQDGISSFSLYYREGEIFHAQGSELCGESAFFAAMSMEEGTFHFVERKDLPDDSTIKAQTQFLILEALRQIDEARAHQAK